MQRRAAQVAFAIVLILGAATIVCSSHRVLTIDESEYLQSGWLMNSGKVLYHDFVEDHAPYLFVIFEHLVPEPFDARTYAARARLFCGAAGLLAVLFASLIVREATRSWIASLVTAAVLIGVPASWNYAIADARNDPPALLLFWLGAWLIVVAGKRSIAWASSGIGLIAFAALWNPKWPLESIVFGVVFLAMAWRSRRWVAALVPAALVTGAGVAILAVTTGLRDYRFFVFSYNQQLFECFRREPLPPPLSWIGLFLAGTPPALPLLAAIALAILLLPRFREGADTRLMGIVGVIVVAASIEMTFFYALPTKQYTDMWWYALAMLYGCVAARLTTGRMREIAAVAATLVIFAANVAWRLDPRAGDAYWRELASLRRELRPGDSVWLFNFRPLGSSEASYYWFAFDVLVPCSLAHARPPLPRMTEGDLPLCQLAEGKPTTVRLVTIDFDVLHNLPKSCECARTLIARGTVRPTRYHGVYVVVR